MFVFQDTQGPVEVAFTDRRGGVSDGPFASLNLAGRSADSDDAVAENVGRVVAGLTRGRDLRRLMVMHQVHGADVHVVDESTLAAGEPPVCDAMVTRLPRVALMVQVADCVPVLLADPAAGVVGAAHAGRPGLAAGIVPNAVRVMAELGGTDVRAWVGPHVCGRCYEVPEPMRAEVTAVVPEAFAETSWGTPSLDLGAGVRAQLMRAGVDVVDASRCTLEHEDLYSYRRQGERSGRSAGLVWRCP